MITYSIKFSPKAKLELEKLDENIRQRIIEKLRLVRDYPQRYLFFLTKRKDKKLRVGDYRLFVDLENDTLIIRSIKHRKKAYKKE